MSNQITISVEFYFKGKQHCAAIELDLDQHMRSTGKLPALYPLLAKAIDLDLYSYEYEMMQAETILFNKATGLAAEYTNEGAFNFAAFKEAWTEISILERLELIAQQELSIEDLQQHPKLKSALLKAYRLGESAKKC